VNGNVKLGRAAARSGEWAQHFSNASCFYKPLAYWKVIYVAYQTASFATSFKVACAYRKPIQRRCGS